MTFYDHDYDDHDENSPLSQEQWDRHASEENATAMFSGREQYQATFPGWRGFTETENQYSLKYKKAQKAEENPPWMTRPADDGSKQMGFDEVGGDKAFVPKDEVEHSLKVNNPQLNGIQFKTYTGPGSSYQVEAFDTTNGGSYAGHLKFLKPSAADVTDLNHPDPDDMVPGEVEMVRTNKEHQGRGIATAMWDYAMAKAQDGTFSTEPVHSAHRSVAGDRWAHFVGGQSRPRLKGFGNLEY